MTERAKLIERLENATEGSRELDDEIWRSLCWEELYRDFPRGECRFTTDLNAAEALVKRLLPGWLYSVCHCHVSDDAWLQPDFNDPAHSERLMQEFGNVEGDPSQYWQEVTDVALHPPRGLALALCLAALKAMEAKDGR